MNWQKKESTNKIDSYYLISRTERKEDEEVMNRTSEKCRTSLSAPSYVLWVFSDRFTFELYQTLKKKN